VARLRLETLQHAFLECPAVRPALEWLARVWPRIDGGGPPPLTAEVWLLGVSTTWQPQGRALAQLWRTLRVALLAAAWQLRTRREAAGEQFTAADVCAAFVEDVGCVVHADWQRVKDSVTDMAGAHASWFPRGRKEMSVVDFEVAWCAGGVIAHVTHGGSQPTMAFWLDGELPTAGTAVGQASTSAAAAATTTAAAAAAAAVAAAAAAAAAVAGAAAAAAAAATAAAAAATPATAVAAAAMVAAAAGPPVVSGPP
jgi:hypothetical protein